MTKDLPVSVKTIFASACASSWRIISTPIDTIKTILQVEGKNGIQVLMNKYKVNGIFVFWYGALATISANFVGHYPWFATFNTLQELIPKQDSIL